MGIKIRFPINKFALSLALKQRPGATRKWPICVQYGSDKVEPRCTTPLTKTKPSLQPSNAGTRWNVSQGCLMSCHKMIWFVGETFNCQHKHLALSTTTRSLNEARGLVNS